MIEDKNFIIAGVGGQGIILMSEVIAQVFVDAGYDVKKSEIHGMAQRGGSVICHLRVGKKVHSPLVVPKTADYLLAMELLEAYRYLGYLKKEGHLIVQDCKILPLSVISGLFKYPDNLLNKLKERCKSMQVIPNSEVIYQLKDKGTVNMLMVGVLANHFAFDKERWESAIRLKVTPKTIDINIEAFRLGLGDQSKNLRINEASFIEKCVKI